MPDTRLGGGERLNPCSTQMFAWARELTCKMGFEVVLHMEGRCLWKWRGAGRSMEMRIEKWGRAGMGKLLLARLAGSALYTECLLKGWFRS